MYRKKQGYEPIANYTTERQVSPAKWMNCVRFKGKEKKIGVERVPGKYFYIPYVHIYYENRVRFIGLFSSLV